MDAESGGECHVLRLQPPSSRQRKRTGPDVLAGEPPVGADLQAGGNGHCVALAARVLLHVDSIGTRRHRRPGEDLDGLAGSDGALRATAGEYPIDDA